MNYHSKNPQMGSHKIGLCNNLDDFSLKTLPIIAGIHFFSFLPFRFLHL